MKLGIIMFSIAALGANSAGRILFAIAPIRKRIPGLLSAPRDGAMAQIVPLSGGAGRAGPGEPTPIGLPVDSALSVPGSSFAKA